MNDAFETLVFVKVGKDCVEEIASAEEASDFLERWSGFRGGRLYEIAHKACQAAQHGEVTAAAARAAFVTWARWADILEEASILPPWMIAVPSGREGAPT